MCINLGSWAALLSPMHLVGQAAQKAGLDSKTAAIISGDPVGLANQAVQSLGFDAKTAAVISGDIPGCAEASQKQAKEEAKAAEKNNAAWQRYYTTRNSQLNTTSSLATPPASPANIGKSGGF